MPAINEFTIGATVTVDDRRVLRHDLAAYRTSTTEFRVHLKDKVEHAWVRWTGQPEPLGRGRAVVIALSCAYCAAHTTDRCCEFAFCQAHRDQHQAIEHLAPDAGRYQAALDCAREVLDHRYGPTLPKPAGLRYPRDLSLSMTSRPGDALRVIEHLRHATFVPEGPDPIGDALHELAASGGRLPTSAKIRWVAADILARCTWPALAEAAGDQETARWMRRQPRVTNDKPAPLSERLYSLDSSIFGLGRVPERTLPGQAAAADALCGLWPIVPNVGRGALGFSSSVGSEVLSHALALPGGAERTGQAIARAQEDAIATALTAVHERLQDEGKGA